MQKFSHKTGKTLHEFYLNIYCQSLITYYWVKDYRIFELKLLCEKCYQLQQKIHDSEILIFSIHFIGMKGTEDLLIYWQIPVTKD